MPHPTMSKETTSNDGVVKPSGAILAGVAPIIYAAGIPLTSYLTQPGGLFEKALNSFLSSITYIGTAGTSSAVSATGALPTLSVAYLFATYALGGAISASALDMSSEQGRDNTAPRAQVRNLSGLPLRMHSTAAHLMEVFPGFVLSAALAMVVAPTDRQVINLLGLHVLSKVFLFAPSYIVNIGHLRSVGHVLSVSSMIGAAWKISRIA